MKKIFACLAVVISTAAAADNTGYFSTLHPAAGIAAMAVPATNITVVNYSDETIFALVPNSPIYDQLLSGKSDTISNNSLYSDTHLVLQDWNRNTFFEQNVCRRAIVTVDGRPGNYHINVDRKFCS